MTGERKYYIVCSDENKYPENLPDDCSVIDELSSREYRLIRSFRESHKRMEERQKWRKEHGLPDPKPSCDDFGTPACTEDGEYMLSR